MSSVDSEVNALLNELIDTVSELPSHTKEGDENESSSSAIDVSDFAEMIESSSMVQKDCSSDEEIEFSSGYQRKFTKKKTSRSVSHSESEIESQTKNIRRKFGSEGEIISLCEKNISSEQQKELNEAIEKYVEKLVKDSVFKAVKNLNVKNLCRDAIHNISTLKEVENTESEEEYIVEQRLSSGSISELVELENSEDFQTEKNDNQCESLNSERNRKISETESIGNVDDVSFGGYLADLDDTASIDDLKSIGGDSFNNSSCSGLENVNIVRTNSEEIAETSDYNSDGALQSSDSKVIVNETESINTQMENAIDHSRQKDSLQLDSSNNDQIESNLEHENIDNSQVNPPSQENADKQSLDTSDQEHHSGNDEQTLSGKNNFEQEKICDSNKKMSETENASQQDQNVTATESPIETVDLIAMSPEDESLLLKNSLKTEEIITPLDRDEDLCQQKASVEEQMKINWKVGNLQVKLPHKTRGKAHLKAWKKRRVVIQPDEFVNDPKNPSMVISVYGSDSKKHETTFWYSVSSLKAVVFRSSSRTHRYAFTISEGGQAIIHLSADNESTTQEWMAEIRAILWPPSPFMELEKMLSGREFEISIIDNEFSYHCGLLGMYGYLSITPKKLILIHPQQGYVIQEWYLNTVDKFQFVPQPKSQDEHKILCMTTCSDSSTGHGTIIFFCNESVTLLQSLASNIHQVLSYHSKQEGGKYKKELEEIAEWLIAPPQDCLKTNEGSEEHYKIPPRQVKSLLDIPNFIFNKSLSPVASAIYPAPNPEIMEPLDVSRNKQITASHDSGISTCTSSEDFLNCSVTSFVIGGGPMTGKSSDSELSDAYTPPRTPEVKKKIQYEVVKEEQLVTDE